MSATVIKSCICEHAFQDKQYGKGNRVFNISGKEDSKLKCTVCNRMYDSKKSK